MNVLGVALFFFAVGVGTAQAAPRYQERDLPLQFALSDNDCSAIFGGCVGIPLYGLYQPKETGAALRYGRVGTFQVGMSDVNITLLHRWRDKESGIDYYQVGFLRYGQSAGQALVKPDDIDRYLAGPGHRVARGPEPSGQACSQVTC